MLNLRIFLMLSLRKLQMFPIFPKCRLVYENRSVGEDFVGFVGRHDENYKTVSRNLEPTLSGTVIGDNVINFLNNINLSKLYCVGVCSDWCSVMTSEQRGAAKQFQTFYQYATRTMCYNHYLNLSLSKASNVLEVRNKINNFIFLSII